jgi:hypothetical protein
MKTLSSIQITSCCNRVRATFSGLDRIDEQDYPDAAIREALLKQMQAAGLINSQGRGAKKRYLIK